MSKTVIVCIVAIFLCAAVGTASAAILGLAPTEFSPPIIGLVAGSSCGLTAVIIALTEG